MENLNRIKSKISHYKGFTLLEIIIVIIIIGILASLALPRYLRTVEYARGFEALVELGTLRQSMYRYYIPKQDFAGATLDSLDVENPNGGTGTHFTYDLVLGPAAPKITTYVLTATRNTLDNTNPPPVAWISINELGQKAGFGAYASIR